MQVRTKDEGSRNLLRGPGPYYHTALWSYGKEPFLRVRKDGAIESGWSGSGGIRVRQEFTIDDVINYFYDKFGIFSPEIRAVRRAADIGAVQALIPKVTLDQLLFAIDIMWEEHWDAKRVPSLISAVDYIAEAQARISNVAVKLHDLLAPLWKERYERMEGGGGKHVARRNA